MYTLYILYDKARDKYYIGQTGNIADRLQRHIEKRSKYTQSGNWELVYTEKYDTRSLAMARERYLKNQKSKIIIARLVRTSRH